MAFEVQKSGDILLVDVDGQLIVGNRQELKQRVLDELEGGERKFVIDFTNTGYIDSSGLGVLVSLSKKIREQGGELRLASLDHLRDGVEEGAQVGVLVEGMQQAQAWTELAAAGLLLPGLLVPAQAGVQRGVGRERPAIGQVKGVGVPVRGRGNVADAPLGDAGKQ